MRSISNHKTIHVNVCFSKFFFYKRPHKFLLIVTSVCNFRHSRVKQLHQVPQENLLFVVRASFHRTTNDTQLIAFRSAVFDRRSRNILPRVFVDTPTISCRFVTLNLQHNGKKRLEFRGIP